MAELTDKDRAILDFERQHSRYLGAKDAEVRTRFGVTLARYHEWLNALLDRPEALAHAPATVRRLRRLRQKRLAARRADRRSA
jgi:hypothetical protein